MSPLVTVCLPLNVSLSSVLGLAEPLLELPQAAVAATVSMATMSMTTLLNAVFRRCIAIRPSPTQSMVGTYLGESSSHTHPHAPVRHHARAPRLAKIMTPRTILYTGKGGVGKTSVAAATARACAAAGLRTLVISTDPAHSLSESLGARLGPEPSPVADRLWGQEVNAQEEMERHWAGVQEWLSEVFVERGVDRISAQELTVPPGMDELFSLLRLQAAHESPDWDAIIVDCAPTGETLRMLSFPDVARWWIEKVF